MVTEIREMARLRRESKGEFFEPSDSKGREGRKRASLILCVYGAASLFCRRTMRGERGEDPPIQLQEFLI